MSRIGNKIITIPEGLNVTISEGLVDIKGKFGEDKIPFNKDFISVEIKDNILTVKRANDEKALVATKVSQRNLLLLVSVIELK